jgi:hypothetical protein
MLKVIARKIVGPIRRRLAERQAREGKAQEAARLAEKAAAEEAAKRAEEEAREAARRAEQEARDAAQREAAEHAARRRAVVDTYYGPPLALAEDWIRADKEISNFYYDLTDLNRCHLRHLMATVSGVDPKAIAAYIAELDDDRALLEHLQTGVLAAYPNKDIEVAYGRRLGWYAAVRALKPRVVVETGVDHGVGACVLSSALLRNWKEGNPGRYYGFDILPSAGRLLQEPYSAVGQLIVGDSVENLERFDKTIDLFINDSDHSVEYEAREYRTIATKLSEKAVILGDNSHYSDALPKFAESSGRKFLYFHESPKAHWYPGAGIGVAFR